ncbi:MAG: hypothetical protein WCG21_05480 [Eubacteriales bacterium]
MNMELIFQIVFWIFMLCILIFNRIIPLIRAGKTGGKILPDKKAAKNEGASLFILRIFLGVFFFFLLLFYSVYPRWMDILLLAILTIVWTLLRIPREEKMMIAQFGDAYRQYMQKTGRLLPKLMKLVIKDAATND